MTLSSMTKRTSLKIKHIFDYNYLFLWLVIMPTISTGADGGPRSRFCARLTLRSAPHRHQRNFFGASVWKGVVKSKNTKIDLPGAGGVPQICFHPNFLLLKKLKVIRIA